MHYPRPSSSLWLQSLSRWLSSVPKSNGKDLGILVWAWTCTVMVAIVLVLGLVAQFKGSDERDSRGDRIEGLVSQSARQLEILEAATSPEQQRKSAESLAKVIASLNDYNRQLHCQLMAEVARLATELGLTPSGSPECP